MNKHQKKLKLKRLKDALENRKRAKLGLPPKPKWAPTSEEK